MTVAAIAASLLVAVVFLVSRLGRLGNDRRVMETRPTPRPDVESPPLLADNSSQVILRAQDWLVAVQEADGSWNPERWGGDPAYGIAVTGLCVLTLSGSDRPRVADASAKATDFLLRAQLADGSLGTRFRGSLYNHSIGTLALIEVNGARSAGRTAESIQRAIIYLEDHQAQNGAWGYFTSGEPLENGSISVWALQALYRARSLGLEHDPKAIERGSDWFEHSLSASTPVVYVGRGDHICGDPRASASITAWATVLGSDPGTPTGRVRNALDRLARLAEPGVALSFYESYFLLRTLSVENLPGLRDIRSEAQRGLVSSQVRVGSFAGSWEPSDRWSPVGGRLYSTALAALALKASEV